MTNPADAAARSLAKTVSQGFRLSEREIAQKSCPSGAPMRAAAANMADTPGRTSTCRSRHAGLPCSIASNTALAIPNTPASPEETIATRLPAEASDNA